MTEKQESTCIACGDGADSADQLQDLIEEKSAEENSEGER